MYSSISIITLALASLLIPANHETDGIEPSGDSLLNIVELQEVNIVSSIKEHGTVRDQPSSVSTVTSSQLRASGVTTLKGVSSLVPNFYMPDYGSRLTSAVYIRGIGSRIGTPAIGMYVDNVPYYDKTAFDFNFLDVQRVDVLRGPQATLYGRNTMGGLVRVITRNPFDHQGTDITLSGATKDLHRRISASHFSRLSDRLAFSLSAFYEAGDGFFTNDLTGRKVDSLSEGGARMRFIYRPTSRLSFDGSLSYEYSDEGAYPYFYIGTTDGERVDPTISANLEGRYRRGIWNANVNTEYRTDRYTFNSVTSYQNITDRMFMDQDFISDDIYSLMQRQRINTLSEELLLKNRGSSWWQRLTGASFTWQMLNTKAPVTFRTDGVKWLNSIINTNANAHMPAVTIPPMTMQFNFDDHINGDRLLFDNDFDTPMISAAIFHQSTLSDLFGVSGLSATLGLRLDYEKMWMDYDSWYDFTHTYSLAGHLSGPMTRDITMVPSHDFTVGNTLQGSLSHDYLQLLPRIAVKYELPEGNVYASISRGYRSGGYNIQNVSELMRSMMTADMMSDVAAATIPVLNNQPMIPADTKEMIAGILSGMASTGDMNVSEACLYKPEYAWNYEVGTHLNLFDNRLNLDASLFYSDVRDLQLSQMTTNGFGRITVNAGKSYTLGGELSARAIITPSLMLTANYGYTHAVLRNYHDYDASGKEIDCTGNYVPFMPRHTLTLDAAYTFRFAHTDRLFSLHSLTLGATYTGAGRIYWTELNDASQPYYSLLGARINLGFPAFDIQIYGRNLTDHRFNTFLFTSMDRIYEQHGKPLQICLDLNIHL